MVAKLLDWIDIENIDWRGLSYNENPEAIELLKQNQDKIDWERLSRNENPEAIELLKQNPKKIDWNQLSYNENPEAIELLKQNQDKIDWWGLSYNKNPEAIELLKQNQDKIDWWGLSYNKNPEAIKLLQQNPNKIIWKRLSSNENPEAIKLLQQNPNKIIWKRLSSNENPEAIELLQQNQDKIDWEELSMNSNPEAIELLKQNQDKIDWYGLSYNKNPEAIELLKQNQDKIDWWGLSCNKNPEAIELLKQNQDKIDWNELSMNPSIFCEESKIENTHNKSIDTSSTMNPINIDISQSMFNPYFKTKLQIVAYEAKVNNNKLMLSEKTINAINKRVDAITNNIEATITKTNEEYKKLYLRALKEFAQSCKIVYKNDAIVFTINCETVETMNVKLGIDLEYLGVIIIKKCNYMNDPRSMLRDLIINQKMKLIDLVNDDGEYSYKNIKECLPEGFKFELRQMCKLYNFRHRARAHFDKFNKIEYDYAEIKQRKQLLHNEFRSYYRLFEKIITMTYQMPVAVQVNK